MAAAATPAERRQVRGPGMPLVLVAVILALLTSGMIAALRAHATERRAAQVLAADLRAAIAEHTSGVWQTVVDGAAAAPVERLTALRSDLDNGFQQLARVDGGTAAPRLYRALADYEAAAAVVVTAGDLADPRRAPAVTAMQQASDELTRLIRETDASHAAAAATTGTLADVGTATTLVSAAVLLALLFRRYERARRRAAVLSAERQALRASEQRFRALVQRSSEVTMVIDRQGAVRYASPSTEQMLGLAPRDVVGRSVRGLLHPDDVGRLDDLLEDPPDGRQREVMLAWRLLRSDGSWLEVDTTVNNLLREPYVQGIVLNSRDASERRILERQLYRQAFHDELTGLPNRAQFADRVRSGLDRSHRRGDTVALLLLDLDRFKAVNDTMGHAAGDTLLAAVASRLVSCLRSGDVAARLAGDEFVVFLEEAGSPADAVQVAERIIEQLARPFQVDGRDVVAGASIGVVCTAARTDLDQLLRHADEAMYRAKADPERRYALHDLADGTAAAEAEALEAG